MLYQGNKSIKKAKEDAEARARNQQPETQPEKRSWEEEISETLREVMQKQESIKPRVPEMQKPLDMPVPEQISYEDTVFSSSEMNATRYEEFRQREIDELAKSDQQSIEFQHIDLNARQQGGSELTHIENEPSIGAEILHEERFDARKAFVYSEVFNRKWEMAGWVRDR